MIFDIRNYIWNIFEISITQKLGNVRAALDLFIINVELGYSRYNGADYLDYSNISDLWNELSESDKNRQKKIFNNIICKVFTKLSKAWYTRDRQVFNALCFTELEDSEDALNSKPNNKDKRKKK